MDLGSVALGVVGLALGAAGIVVTRHYSVCTTHRSLSVYTRIASGVLGGVEPLLRAKLQIRYQEVEVKDLFQVQFTIVNDGRPAIRDCVEPLSVTLPRGTEVLDVQLVDVKPKGRRVEAHPRSRPDGSMQVEFPFALLNRGESFDVRLLLRGAIDPARLEFMIQAEDLPPVIRPKPFPVGPGTQGGAGQVRFDLAMALWLILFAIGNAYLVWLVWETCPQFRIPGANLKAAGLPVAVMLFCGMCDLVLLLAGSVGIAQAVRQVRCRSLWAPASPTKTRQSAGRAAGSGT